MKKIHEIVERLAVNEEKVMELYSVFSEKFPEHAQFWKEISGEEKRHALLLRDFGGMVDARDIKLNLDHINADSVEKSISYLSDEIEKAKKGEIDCVLSFKLALNLEKGIIESDCFKVFNSDVKDLEKLFKALRDDTQRHWQLMDAKYKMICGDNRE